MNYKIGDTVYFEYLNSNEIGSMVIERIKGPDQNGNIILYNDTDFNCMYLHEILSETDPRVIEYKNNHKVETESKKVPLNKVIEYLNEHITETGKTKEEFINHFKKYIEQYECN